MDENILAFLFGDSIEADYAFKRELLLAEEEAKEERMKHLDEQIKYMEDQQKIQDERLKVLGKQAKVLDEQNKVLDEQNKALNEQNKALNEQNKALNEQNKAQIEEVQHLNKLHQQAIQNIMRTFNISEKEAHILFS